MINRGYIEFFLADHCNLKCAHCSHFSPFMKPWTPELSAFKDDIAALAEVMQVGRFRFLGGEPLLNREFPQFVEAVIASGLARKVGICTNGLLLHKADKETLSKLDWVDVSLYPGTVPDSDTISRRAESICGELGITLNLYPKPDFRYQILDHPIEDEQAVQDIYDTCKMAHGGWDMFHDGCHTIYQGHYYKCNRPAYTRSYLERRGCGTGESLPDFSERDGVPLHAPELKERLIAYLLDKEPLQACRWCLGTCGTRLPHRMLSKDEIKRNTPQSVEWREVFDEEALAEGAKKLKPVKARTRRSLERARK